MINSLKKNKKGILLMLCSSLFVCIGQLFWKLSTTGNFFFLILGFTFYGCGALIMLYAYKFGSLSVLQPILSANYVFTIILSSFILHEPFTLFKLTGILVITIGVIFIGGAED